MAAKINKAKMESPAGANFSGGKQVFSSICAPIFSFSFSDGGILQ